MRILDEDELEKMNGNQKIVITYGTFDLFHEGHYNILKRAKQMGDYLIVGVTGETYDIERGKLSVQDSLVERIENVKKTGFADQIIVEEYLGQKIQDILKYNVDILVVGSDWKGQFDHMRKYCEVVYLERTKNISSTMLRNKKKNILKLGIATDSTDDNDIVQESKYVSGVHVESVFSEDSSIAAEFCDRYELGECHSEYDVFLDSIDIVYVNCGVDARYELIKKALEKDKVVISAPIVSYQPEQVKELYSYAKENNKILIECVTTFYLQAFIQLLWNAKGYLIGDIKCVKNSICLGGIESINRDDYYAHIYVLILLAKQFFGNTMTFHVDRVDSEDSRCCHAAMIGRNDKSLYLSEIGTEGNVDCDMIILGSDGEIHVPSNWWETGYFEIRKPDGSVKRYSWNFEGNGMRYLITTLLTRVKTNDTLNLRLPADDVIDAVEIIDGMRKNG